MLKINLFILIVTCCSCSRSFPIRASLDKSRWFASLSNGTPKIYEEERLSLIFATDLPHPELKEKTVGKVTGCKGKCQRTQTLILSNIPLRSGFYRVAQSDTDSLQSNSIYCVYDTQGVEQINTRVYKKAEGWLQITQYDSTTNQVKGKFDIRFQASDGSSRSVHFRRGKLDFLLKKKPLT
jgi:hypothetical protein